MPPSETTSSGPWWKYGHVWLVASGPAIVVIACLVTIWIAISTPDPVYTDSRTSARAVQPADEPALAPAVQARNHAATGGVDASRQAPTARN